MINFSVLDFVYHHITALISHFQKILENANVSAADVEIEWTLLKASLYHRSVYHNFQVIMLTGVGNFCFHSTFNPADAV